MYNNTFYKELSDYLTNAIDRDSDEQMTSYLTESFQISNETSYEIVKDFIQKFSKVPIPLEVDVLELLKRHLVESKQ